MSAKMYAILTIVVVGLGAFFIGWLLMSSRWKKKFFEADRKKSILENKTTKQAALIDKSKEALKETKQHLLMAQTELNTVEKEMSNLRRKNSSLKNKSLNSSYSDHEYNRLLDELKLEKKKNATLKADVKRAVDSNRIVSINSKKGMGTNNNLKSSQQQVVSTSTTTKQTPSKKNTLDASSPLFPILQRISIFSNLEQEDDLSLINGIDETLARQLNEVGIINFKQIAMLTQNDLNTISLEMQKEKSQAMNDSWVAQARTLYHKKYSS